jgi:hypothetical protein
MWRVPIEIPSIPRGQSQVTSQNEGSERGTGNEDAEGDEESKLPVVCGAVRESSVTRVF